VNRTYVLTLFLTCACVAPAAFAAGAAATQPLDLRAGPHLFVDDFLIADARGVKKVTQHPTRLPEPVLGWQQHTTQPYVTVLRDPQTKRFRMWYNAHAGKEATIAYAESADGVKWETPRLGIMGDDNRLFLIGRSSEHGSYGVSVIDDAERESDPQRRYKLMWWSGLEPAGASVAWSADGLRWTKYDKNPVLPYYPTDHGKAGVGVGDIVDIFYDPLRNRYASLFKLHAQKSDGWSAGPRAGSAFRRLVGTSWSDDFLNWRDPRRVFTPEPRDAGQLEFYSSGGTIARGPLLITFIRMLHDDYAPEPGGEPTGIGYTTLGTSRDGQTWQRHDDVFLDRNPTPGTWDRAMTWVGSALPVGDELYLYYGGYKRGHKVEPTKERQIGLAKMKTDRFVAREASGATPGVLRTALLRAGDGKGSTLVLNADASKGRIRAQVRYPTGGVIPGFAYDDAEPVTGDGLALPVKWKGQLADLRDDVRLEFEITDAKLFGFDVR
jgi:hypothetical protein